MTNLFDNCCNCQDCYIFYTLGKIVESEKLDINITTENKTSEHIPSENIPKEIIMSRDNKSCNNNHIVPEDEIKKIDENDKLSDNIKKIINVDEENENDFVIIDVDNF
jgi:hypothetical protein